MKSLHKHHLKAMIFFLIAFFPGLLGAYDGSQYGRVTYFDDTVTIQKATETSFDTVDINFPIEAGDRVWTDSTGRIEFQLADSSFVRMDINSKLDFQAISSETESYAEATILRLWSGSIYIRAERFDSPDKVFQIDTPSASIYIVDTGLFRIDLYEDGTSGLTVFSGVAEVVGEGGSVLVISGQRTFTSPGSLPMNPESFNSFERDDFDLWNDSREEAIAQLVSSDNPTAQEIGLPAEILPYYDELAYYGFWDYIPGYGYGWCPYGVGIGWRPYYSGFWFWFNWGWCWIGYEPWGWCPYHYGYWDYCGGYGWTWFPGRVWSSAWVTWAVGQNSVGWSPLLYSGSGAGKEPLAFGGAHNQGTPLGFKENDWIFVDRESITSRNIDGIKYSPERITKLNVSDVTFYVPDASGRNTARVVSTPESSGKMSYSLPEKDSGQSLRRPGQEPGSTGMGLQSRATPSGKSKYPSSPTYQSGTKSTGSATTQGKGKTYSSHRPTTKRSGYPPSTGSGKKQKSQKNYSRSSSLYGDPYGTRTGGQSKSEKKYTPYVPSYGAGKSSYAFKPYGRPSATAPKSSPYLSGFLNSQRSKSGYSRRAPGSLSAPGKFYSSPPSRSYSSAGSKGSSGPTMSGRSSSRPSGSSGAGRMPSGGGGSRSTPSASRGGKSSGKR